ncbi:MAG: Ti-type conjugative transfer relaxase TraA [Alphaproteobacteria bacterium]|nr:Ti-type conjugative transfer relaxase TraA [Alphaproteobacteria bacterium]MDE2110513.1 Ti-type conjugative transfer relaxase TraA [Alphaproteobacteria bacterium]MDE2493263.1 Ti-type conjugative transfer relaxase TraA [Alphaproteobacteria bacterium]
MAIYHFSAKVIGRANGSSALASAAYRSASRLYDERPDRHHDFSNKAGVIHSEVLTPENTPDELRERERLWNAVEAAEKRKDAQLAREVEFAIPRELSQEQGIELARDFVKDEFVSQGMIADLNVHWDIGAGGQAKPHAHVMLTMRAVDENGFGAKVRDWNRTERLEHWREAWGTHVNERLAELGIEARIDHRSLEQQGIDLEPQHKIGAAALRMSEEGLDAERLEDHRKIARENGIRIIADPSIALDAITRQQATFTRQDLAMFVHRHSDGLEQFNRVMGAVEASPELVRLGRDGHREERFTSREMLAVEQRLHRTAEHMAERRHHRMREGSAELAVERARADGLVLSREQRAALVHITGEHDLGIVVGYAGSGKSAMLGVAREAWEESGNQVRGAALSGIAAEALEQGSGIPSRTLASLEYHWAQGRELLTNRDVLVIDEAGMVGSRQMERVLSEAERRGTKVVLVGDPEQLQAIEAGAAFRSLLERHPHVEIHDIRRQRESWQQDATRQLATGRTDEALEAYRENGMVQPAPSREEAREGLIERWDDDRLEAPGKSRIILTHTNDEVRALNEMARGRLREAGQLGQDIAVQVERGKREFAAGDRVLFLKNERGLGVKNGTLGLVETVRARDMTVRLDSGRSVSFDLKDYAQLDHGYAATIHKAQGVTVDRVHVLATPGLDRHAAYVALSRHRERVDLHYGRDDFADEGKLARILSRERAKDMASDYARDQAEVGPGQTTRSRRTLKRALVAEPARDMVADTERGRTRDAGAASHRPNVPEHEKSRGKEQGIFASFRPIVRAPQNMPGPARDGGRDLADDLQGAVRRYARSIRDIVRMEEKGLPVLPHQHQAEERARAALDAIRLQAARDLASALERDPGLVREAAKGQTQRAIRAMQLESEIRHDPKLRADRFVERWQNLDRQRLKFERGGNWQGEQSVRTTMGAMAKSLERDAQMESVLRNRSRELGIGIDMGRGVGRNLLEYLGLSRGLGLSL